MKDAGFVSLFYYYSLSLKDYLTMVEVPVILHGLLVNPNTSWSQSVLISQTTWLQQCRYMIKTPRATCDRWDIMCNSCWHCNSALGANGMQAAGEGLVNKIYALSLTGAENPSNHNLSCSSN